MSNTSMVSAEQWQLTEDKIKTLERAGIIPADTPPAQIAVFAEVCRRHNLDPFLKQVYLVGYAGKYSVIVGIDGFRSRAERTGLHAGTDEAKFNMTSGGQWKSAAELAPSVKTPTSATVTVYKVVGGVRVPFVHTALFAEFAQRGGKWPVMPYQMLAKVAESHALRKAFPEALSGLHTHEEIAAITDQVEPEARPETEEETLENEVKDAVIAILEAMDHTDKKACSKIIKFNWHTPDNLTADPEWKQLIIEKHQAEELDEKFLINYTEIHDHAEQE